MVTVSNLHEKTGAEITLHEQEQDYKKHERDGDQFETEARVNAVVNGLKRPSIRRLGQKSVWLNSDAKRQIVRFKSPRELYMRQLCDKHP